MAHPWQHSLSSVNKFGGKPEDYLHIHQWFDESKSWYAQIYHRAFRHHTQGIFECEQRFGTHFKNSDGKTVYTRYIGEQHVREDLNNYIPTPQEWMEVLLTGEKPMWFLKTMKLNIED
jgi:hypothetical protein